MAVVRRHLPEFYRDAASHYTKYPLCVALGCQVFDDNRQFAEWFDSMLEADEGDDDDDGMGGADEVNSR